RRAVDLRPGADEPVHLVTDGEEVTGGDLPLGDGGQLLEAEEAWLCRSALTTADWRRAEVLGAHRGQDGEEADRHRRAQHQCPFHVVHLRAAAAAAPFDVPK